jgi:CheY-like chemotaxis protein
LAIAIHNAQLLKDLKQAHAELLRTKTYEALATSTTEAVHWIGNKAMPITTTVARMRSDLAAGEIDVESLSEDLELVADSAQQIVEVKENLLGAAREQCPRPVMLDDIWEYAAYHRRIPLEKISISIDPDTPMAFADSAQMVRAFGNLLQNAVEAQAEHIHVEISPGENGFVSVRLSDDGQGIPAEIKDKIWAAFFSTKGMSHQGLGLAACLHVITQHDGRISVESTPGKNTTFTILLPVSSETITKVDLSGVPHRILLIDNNDTWAKFVVATLTGAGKKVARKQEFIAADGVDLILVDEVLNVVPVKDVLQSLAEAGVADKTILVTAAPKVEQVTKYLKMGIKDATLKPYTPGELLELLTRVVGK